MRYDIGKASAPTLLTLEKGTDSIKIYSRRYQKTYTNPSFRCFSLFLAHTSVARNFSTQPHLEGKKWHDGQLGGRKWGK